MENVYQNENITTNKERQNIYENENNRKKTTTNENNDGEEDIYHTRPSEVEAIQVQVALRRVEKRIEITRARKPKQRVVSRYDEDMYALPDLPGNASPASYSSVDSSTGSSGATIWCTRHRCAIGLCILILTLGGAIPIGILLRSDFITNNNSTGR